MVAARKGNVGIVRKLIQHGANMNPTNKVTPCTPCLVGHSWMCTHTVELLDIYHTVGILCERKFLPKPGELYLV